MFGSSAISTSTIENHTIHLFGFEKKKKKKNSLQKQTKYNWQRTHMSISMWFYCLHSRSTSHTLCVCTNTFKESIKSISHQNIKTNGTDFRKQKKKDQGKTEHTQKTINYNFKIKTHIFMLGMFPFPTKEKCKCLQYDVNGRIEEKIFLQRKKNKKLTQNPINRM